jgi:hypothetical protein
MWPLFVLLLFTWLELAATQYFPPAPKDVTVVKSKLQEGVSISFKEVDGFSTFLETRLTSPSLAWHLRNYVWSQIICWIRPLAARRPG